MGEGDTVEFFSGAETLVFWNIDDYPVPDGTDLVPIESNITEALHQVGFEGSVSVFAHSKQKVLESSTIVYSHKCSVNYLETGVIPTLDMTHYMISLGKTMVTEIVNIAVMAKPTSELSRVVKCLKSRHHNVLLVEPPPYEECLFSVESLVEHARLLGGEKPIPKKELTSGDLRRVRRWEYTDGGDVIHAPNNTMVDFSEPITHVRGTRSVMFWDAVDCPFPPSLSPDEIYEKLKTLLLESGCNENIAIWAYCNEDNKYLHDKTWDSKIYFLPGGDIASRRVRMLNDIYLLLMDSSRLSGGSLFLVSDHFLNEPSYIDVFRNLGGSLFLMIPSEHVNISENPEWPVPLFDSCYAAPLFDRNDALFYETAEEASQGPCLKKFKLDVPKNT